MLLCATRRVGKGMDDVIATMIIACKYNIRLKFVKPKMEK